jgi:lipid A disaccharide synthetase
MSSLSFLLIKKFNLVSVKYEDLPNILLGYEYFKEFLQKDLNAKNISDEELRLLHNTSNDYSDPLTDLHLKLLAPDEKNVASEIASFLER